MMATKTSENIQMKPEREIWVQCEYTTCMKWRRVNQAEVDTGNAWFCHMNQDSKFASCSVPQEKQEIPTGHSVIYSQIPAGEIVLAKMASYPKWPAIISPDPMNGNCNELDHDGDVTYYHVEFYGKPHSHMWILSKHVEYFGEASKPDKKDLNMFKSMKNQRNQKSLQISYQEVEAALKLSRQERLKNCVFKEKNNLSSSGKEISSLQKGRANIAAKSSKEDVLGDPFEFSDIHTPTSSSSTKEPTRCSRKRVHGKVSNSRPGRSSVAINKENESLVPCTGVPSSNFALVNVNGKVMLVPVIHTKVVLPSTQGQLNLASGSSSASLPTVTMTAALSNHLDKNGRDICRVSNVKKTAFTNTNTAQAAGSFSKGSALNKAYINTDDAQMDALVTTTGSTTIVNNNKGISMKSETCFSTNRCLGCDTTSRKPPKHSHLISKEKHGKRIAAEDSEDQALFHKEFGQYAESHHLEKTRLKISWHRKEINLYRLYSAVVREGGFSKVSKSKTGLWAEICQEIIPTNSSGTFKGLKKEYVRVLLPFETYKEKLKPSGEISAKIPKEATRLIAPLTALSEEGERIQSWTIGRTNTRLDEDSSNHFSQHNKSIPGSSLVSSPTVSSTLKEQNSYYTMKETGSILDELMSISPSKTRDATIHRDESADSDSDADSTFKELFEIEETLDSLEKESNLTFQDTERELETIEVLHEDTVSTNETSRSESEEDFDEIMKEVDTLQGSILDLSTAAS